MSSIKSTNTTNPVHLISANVSCTYGNKARNNICSLCNQSLLLWCNDCLEEIDLSKTDEDDIAKLCPTVVGKCEHGFHKHCIDDWTEDADCCPVDQTKWIKQYGDMNDSK